MLVSGARDYRDALVRRAREHVDTLCVGRTHGVHAEPTTFGVKLAGFAFEADRNLRRLERAVEGVVGGGPVRRGGHLLGQRARGGGGRARAARASRREDVSTQVVPRDRHAELLSAVALAGAGLERFATEVRHLQRTEVREVEEPFRAGAQKGSSAMPHKRNPIVSERITGIARLLRGYAQAGLEDVALWHERDISHSSVERVALPDATTLLDYAQHLAIRVVDGMVVDEERMQANLELTHGALYSQRALLALVEAGRSRDDAYRVVQEAAQRAYREGVHLRELLAEYRSGARPRRVFDAGAFVRNARQIVARLDRLSERRVAQASLVGHGRAGSRAPSVRASGAPARLPRGARRSASRCPPRGSRWRISTPRSWVSAAPWSPACSPRPGSPVRRDPLPSRDQRRRLALVSLGVVLGFPLLTAIALRDLPAAHAAVIVGDPARGHRGGRRGQGGGAALARLLGRRRAPAWSPPSAFAAAQGAGTPQAGDLLLLAAVAALRAGICGGRRARPRPRRAPARSPGR